MRVSIVALVAILFPAVLSMGAAGQIETIAKPSPATAPLPAYPAVPAADPLPGVAARPAGGTPLSAEPYVFRLKHRESGAISPADRRVIRDRQPQLDEQAANFNFDLNSPGWNYRQILCPAFPGYLFLAFEHGPAPDGSSRFVAALSRRNSDVRIVSRYAHGARPFESSPSRPGTYAIFNRMLREQRGARPIGDAPNWLMIAMCYAELSGYPVQVMTPQSVPGATLDMIRLGAGQPQLRVLTDRSAVVTFSDISQPDVTSNWTLRFNPQGQLISADRNSLRQPASIALEPKPRPAVP